MFSVMWFIIYVLSLSRLRGDVEYQINNLNKINSNIEYCALERDDRGTCVRTSLSTVIDPKVERYVVNCFMCLIERLIF
jgi:hypothetical protein